MVLTTPVVRCLKKQIATAELHYLTKASFRPILSANPFVDTIHCLGDSLETTLRQLAAEDFDYVIDLHHNLRSWKVKKALGKPSFSFPKLNIEKWLYTRFKWNRMPAVHIVDRYFQTVAGFGVRNDGAGLDYFIPEPDAVRETDIPTAHHAGYVGMVIGAAHATKKWPLHKWKELAAGLDHPVILLGGKEDVAAGEVIAAVDPYKIYNACGKFNINESADLVRRARVIVTHDTGLMHIAAAFKKPVISIWGNTVPEFGMYPYYGKGYMQGYGGAAGNGTGERPFDILEVRGLSCRPCSKIGYDKCPKGHFKCMEQIAVEELMTAIHKRLGRS